MTPRACRALMAAVILPAMLGGCSGLQSVLAPQGPEADRIALLFWILTGTGALILAGVMMLAATAILGSDRWRGRLSREALIIAGGLVFPVVSLTALLLYGVVLTSRTEADFAADGDVIRISVQGERWWWRVTYTGIDGQPLESANEIRIPANRTIALELTSADVIHSFWVPKLAGKLDMIPGRKNVLRLAAREPGLSRGQCAEYCGGAHALMSFYVVAMPDQEFSAWLARETAPAAAPTEPREIEGRMLFLANGCGACHTVRGTAAAGKIGPDLTHVGSRMSLAAATLPNDAEALARWIGDNQHIKPDNLMPPFRIFSESELASLSRYLASLK